MGLNRRAWLVQGLSRLPLIWTQKLLISLPDTLECSKITHEEITYFLIDYKWLVYDKSKAHHSLPKNVLGKIFLKINKNFKFVVTNFFLTSPEFIFYTIDRVTWHEIPTSKHSWYRHNSSVPEAWPLKSTTFPVSWGTSGRYSALRMSLLWLRKVSYIPFRFQSSFPHLQCGLGQECCYVSWIINSRTWWM